MAEGGHYCFCAVVGSGDGIWILLTVLFDIFRSKKLMPESERKGGKNFKLLKIWFEEGEILHKWIRFNNSHLVQMIISFVAEETGTTIKFCLQLFTGY